MSNRLLDTLDDRYIVCGRGQRTYNNNGNKTLRNVVARYLSIYIDQKTTRSFKTKLVVKTTKEILGMGMVFVKPSKYMHRWEILNYAQARTKVGHRFRDAARRVYSGADELPVPPNPATRGQNDCSSSSAVSFSALTSSIDSTSSAHEENKNETQSVALREEDSLTKIDKNRNAINLQKYHQDVPVPPRPSSNNDKQQEVTNDSLNSLLSNAYVVNPAPYQAHATYFDDEDMAAMLHHLVTTPGEDDAREVDASLVVARSMDEIDKIDNHFSWWSHDWHDTESL